MPRPYQTPEQRLAVVEAEFAKLVAYVGEMAERTRKGEAIHTDHIAKIDNRLDAHNYRIDRHERVMAKSEEELTRHMAVCIRRDTALNAKVDAVLKGIANIRERVSLVEAKAFADVSDVVSVLGAPANRQASEALDRRKRDDRHE